MKENGKQNEQINYALQKAKYEQLQSTYTEMIHSNAELYSRYGWANVTNAVFITVFISLIIIVIKTFSENKKTNSDMIEMLTKRLDTLSENLSCLNNTMINENDKIKECITIAPLKVKPFEQLPKRVLELDFKNIYRALMLKLLDYLYKNNIRKNYKSICKELDNFRTEILNRVRKDLNYIINDNKRKIIDTKMAEYVSSTIEDFKHIFSEFPENAEKEYYEETKRLIISECEELFNNLNTLLDLTKDN